MRKIMLLLAVAIPGLSLALPPKPVCPNVEAIKAVGIQAIERSGDSWVGVINDKFGTDTTWTLKIASFEAEDELMALFKAEFMLHNLEAQYGPEPLNLYGGWGCSYKTKNFEYHALAVTPGYSS